MKLHKKRRITYKDVCAWIAVLLWVPIAGILGSMECERMSIGLGFAADIALMILSAFLFYIAGYTVLTEQEGAHGKDV